MIEEPITQQQATARLSKIALMPSVLMVGVDNNSTSIGMHLNTKNPDDKAHILIGLITAYTTLCLASGDTTKELFKRMSRTIAAVLCEIEADNNDPTLH